MKSWYGMVTRLVVAGFILIAGAGVACAQDYPTKVRTAMKILQDKTLALGAPKVEGGTLLFGSEEMNGSYDLVDEVADNASCTATLFVAAGDGYKRISTNVIQNGNRAVGTMLDPNGTAIKHIRVGEAYYGEADILGEKYETGYEPIKDASGQVIGIWYVGYKK